MWKSKEEVDQCRQIRENRENRDSRGSSSKETPFEMTPFCVPERQSPKFEKLLVGSFLIGSLQKVLVNLRCMGKKAWTL